MQSPPRLHAPHFVFTAKVTPVLAHPSALAGPLAGHLTQRLRTVTLVMNIARMRLEPTLAVTTLS
jgi:hypothetical protein